MITKVLACLRNEASHVHFGLRSRLAFEKYGLDDSQRMCVNEMKRNSAFVIENYWQREKALMVRDKLASVHESNEAYVLGDHTKDEIVRIYHVDRLYEELEQFRYDPFVLGIAQAYNGHMSYSGALVYQHDTVHGRAKSYHHVDTFHRQFKAMLYLDDVDVGNGPFSYFPGSHRNRLRLIKKQLKGNNRNKDTVFEDHEVTSILSSEKQVCLPAGSLLLFDTGCIHRGAPQETRSRSVLMNYIVPTNRELYLNKKAPPT